MRVIRIDAHEYERAYASARGSIFGRCSKVWYGAGDATVHSRPSAPSHTRPIAFSGAAHAHDHVVGEHELPQEEQ